MLKTFHFGIFEENYGLEAPTASVKFSEYFLGVWDEGIEVGVITFVLSEP